MAEYLGANVIVPENDPAHREYLAEAGQDLHGDVGGQLGAGGEVAVARGDELQVVVHRGMDRFIQLVDFAALGENSILIDCDVLVADGGTRTAAITGAAVALHDAGDWLVREGRIAANPVRRLVAAVSVGIVSGEPRLDLEYVEDVAADTDMNIVALEGGGVVEVQGTAEDVPFSRKQFEELLNLAEKGVQALCAHQAKALGLEYKGERETEPNHKTGRRTKCHSCGIPLDDFASAVCGICDGVLCSCGACACGSPSRTKS